MTKAKQTAPADNSAPFTLSRDPRKALAEMSSVIDQIQAIYRQENAALKASDTRAFLTLQEEKVAICLRYQAGIRQIIDRKAEFETVEAGIKDGLKAKQEEFSKIARENMGALDRMRKAVSRLNGRIMETARREATRMSVNYARNGSLLSETRPVSLGLNESA